MEKKMNHDGQSVAESVNATGMVASVEPQNLNVIPTKETVKYHLIYEFDEDPGFNFYKMNRDTKPKHVSEIKNYILNSKFGARFFAPIIVDINTLKVGDGQHRYKAISEAWKSGSMERLKVMFVDLPEDEEEAMAIIVEMNTCTEKWKIGDYMKRQIVSGDEYVKYITKFAEEDPLCYEMTKRGKKKIKPRYAMAIINGRNVTDEIQKGTLEFDMEEGDKFARKLSKELEVIMNAIGYEGGSWHESFYQAYHDIRKNDGFTSEFIDNVGIETISDYLWDEFKGKSWVPVNRKNDCKTKLTAALYNIKTAMENKKKVA